MSVTRTLLHKKVPVAVFRCPPYLGFSEGMGWADISFQTQCFHEHMEHLEQYREETLRAPSSSSSRLACPNPVPSNSRASLNLDSTQRWPSSTLVLPGLFSSAALLACFCYLPSPCCPTISWRPRRITQRHCQSQKRQFRLKHLFLGLCWILLGFPLVVPHPLFRNK